MSTVSPGQTFFSLPTQRCFRVARIELQLVSLFSAYAEVFPAQGFRYLPEISFLCLRRGVSVVIVFRNYKKDFSLPTQRCFLVLPMVLVFYITFLCLRRGVSKTGRDDPP